MLFVDCNRHEINLILSYLILSYLNSSAGIMCAVHYDLLRGIVGWLSAMVDETGRFISFVDQY